MLMVDIALSQSRGAIEQDSFQCPCGNRVLTLDWSHFRPISAYVLNGGRTEDPLSQSKQGVKSCRRRPAGRHASHLWSPPLRWLDPRRRRDTKGEQFAYTPDMIWESRSHGRSYGNFSPARLLTNCSAAQPFLPPNMGVLP